MLLAAVFVLVVVSFSFVVVVLDVASRVLAIAVDNAAVAQNASSGFIESFILCFVLCCIVCFNGNSKNSKNNKLLLSYWFCALLLHQ